MSKKTILLMLIVFLVFSSCLQKNIEDKQAREVEGNKVMRFLLYPFRSGSNINFIGNAKLEKDLYNAVYNKKVDWVREILSKKIDPNRCRGECGWIDANPLNVLSHGLLGTYYKQVTYNSISNIAPDIAVLGLLLDAGADINIRPYIWYRVYLYNNSDLESIKKQREYDGSSLKDEDIKKQYEWFINDVNRLLYALLEAGADPDMLGHSYPFSAEAMNKGINDEVANEYFKKGSRAVNVAIEKGMAWEKQVDLLLEYTDLDSESLEAAKRSNDKKMMEKIERLWIQQQENKKNNN